MKILNRNMHLRYRFLPVNMYESTKLSLASGKLFYIINTIQHTDINIKYKAPLMLYVKRTKYVEYPNLICIQRNKKKRNIPLLITLDQIHGQVAQYYCAQNSSSKKSQHSIFPTCHSTTTITRIFYELHHTEPRYQAVIY